LIHPRNLEITLGAHFSQLEDENMLYEQRFIKCLKYLITCLIFWGYVKERESIKDDIK